MAPHLQINKEPENHLWKTIFLYNPVGFGLHVGLFQGSSFVQNATTSFHIRIQLEVTSKKAMVGWYISPLLA